ncbi:lytic transglycosylase domain-containing protein [Psychrobacter arenosus]|uniref:lytic transglycosylase domain-containing protein n=1 Tax=Psychrobacter arenosus TaxID=256326 RepID=UPI00191B8B16|nr:lytic transglycosylase domain-containing protein [Psychrobacter arenosus]
MATTSLGRLTLDLAVKLSEFTDGMSRAERETEERTRNMSESVRTFRDRLMEDLGGTQLGGVIDGLASRLGGISGGGMLAGAAIAGMAVGGVAVGIGALTNLALETAKADTELKILANTAKVGVKDFQVITHAAAALGVEQDALAGILADTQEKLGEFSATGGGGAADFFEALQNNTEMTDEQIRNLGKTLQGKDGVQAIQLIKDEMDALGATSQEQRFVFESLAGDLGNLLPLFDDGGSLLAQYGTALEDAGVIKTEAAIEQSRRLTAQTQAVSTQFEGFKTQLAMQMMPILNNLMGYFVDGSVKGGQFGSVMESVGLIAKTVGAGIIGVAGGIKILVRMIQAFGEQVANVGITTTNFFEADGFMAKARALKQGFSDNYSINARLASDLASELVATKNAMTGMFTPINSELTGLAGAYYATGEAAAAAASGIAVNTQEAEANAKAQEAAAKAMERAQKAAGKAKGLEVNAKALANADKYGFAAYEAQYGLPYGLMTGIHMQESHGNTKATGPMTKWGQAKGGFQLIDDTARRFEVQNAYNMEQATEGAAKYLSWLYKRFNGDLAKTIAAYNTGEGNVDKHPMSLILSDRWARDKKTGVGQTKQYTKNVLGYMQSLGGKGSDKLVYDSMTAEAKALEKHQQGQQSLVAKYATAREKIEAEHLDNVAEIKKYHAEGSAQYSKLIAREEEQYLEKKNVAALSIMSKYMSESAKIEDDHRKNVLAIEKEFAEGSIERELYTAAEKERYLELKNAKAQSIMMKYMTEEQRLKYEHEQALKEIAEAGIEDDTVRQKYIDLQNAVYQEDLANFKFAQEQKAREQDKAYRSIAQSMRDNISQAASDALDRTAQLSMKPDDYAKWRSAQDYDESFNSVNNQYSNRKAEINAVDERGDPVFDELQRNELLEEARLEHLNNLWAMEQDHALKTKALEQQMQDQRTAIYTGMFSSMTGAAATFFGENSRMHRAAFAMEQAYAVYKATMNAEETYSNVYTAMSAIPIVGPYIAGPAAFAASALQIASAARIKNISAPTVAGIAHGGLDYVPKEATYLLDEGEAVLSPRQNKDLTKFLSESKGRTSSNGGITINNNSSAMVQAERGPDGRVTIEMVDRMINKKFSSLSDKNSHASKQIQRHTTARPKR